MGGQNKTGHWAYIILGAIVLLCALVYLPAINHTTLWEDGELIGGVGIGNPKRVSECFTRPFLYNYYRPLTSLSFYVENRLFGGNPLVQHVTNLGLHLVTIPAVFALILSA